MVSVLNHFYCAARLQSGMHISEESFPFDFHGYFQQGASAFSTLSRLDERRPESFHQELFLFRKSSSSSFAVFHAKEQAC